MLANLIIYCFIVGIVARPIGSVSRPDGQITAASAATSPDHPDGLSHMVARSPQMFGFGKKKNKKKPTDYNAPVVVEMPGGRSAVAIPIRPGVSIAQAEASRPRPRPASPLREQPEWRPDPYDRPPSPSTWVNDIPPSQAAIMGLSNGPTQVVYDYGGPSGYGGLSGYESPPQQENNHGRLWAYESPPHAAAAPQPHAGLWGYEDSPPRAAPPSPVRPAQPSSSRPPGRQRSRTWWGSRRRTRTSGTGTQELAHNSPPAMPHAWPTTAHSGYSSDENADDYPTGGGIFDFLENTILGGQHQPYSNYDQEDCNEPDYYSSHQASLPQQDYDDWTYGDQGPPGEIVQSSPENRYWR